MPESHSNESENASSSQSKSDSYLQSQLLIAMPGLDDPYFKHSVTLICRHDKDGCFGLTINNPIGITISEVFKQLDIDCENAPSSTTTAPVLRGGPVQIEQGFVVHDGDHQWENTLSVNDDLAVTASQDILLDIAAGNGPNNFIFALGCASWEAGQVEGEVMGNSWLNCPVDKKIIFDTPLTQRWQGAADTLGIDLNALSGVSGHD